MKVLQLDVNSVEYEPIEAEMRVHEPADKKSVKLENTLVIFTAFEKDDSEAMASQAVKEALEFAEKNKIKSILFYPFAHLSDNLEEPQRALNLFQYMVKEGKKSKLAIGSAPFGWNKRLKIDVKGHPLAEQSRSYGKASKGKIKTKQPRKVDTTIVRKSDFAGLPETDHRIIGERLDLFSFQEVSPGMVYWHPNGNILMKELMRYIREMNSDYGYEEIATPAFANVVLWHVSGHIDHYRENMYIVNAGNDELALKPMNCPSTMLVYKSRKWSYRDMPVRFSDFDKLYRNEISGALSGLFRVRELTQDDAHVFVATDEQAEQELTSILEMVKKLYGKFNLEYKAKLSTMPDSHLGDEKLWDKATDALKTALKKNGMKFEIKEKEGAFYGPKIDFDIKDSIGREWQCATIQLDYQLPQRFGLEYASEDGRPHTPIVIHRVIYGSLERFIGVLTEHVQGKFPTWLAPVQVRVVTISEQSNEYAEGVYKKLKAAGVRVELDTSSKTLEYKIRDGQLQKIPYLLILGKKEADAKTISIRGRSSKQKMGVKLDEFISSINDEIKERKNEPML